MIQPVVIPIPQGHYPTHMPQQMRPMPPQFQPHPPQYQPQPQFPQPVHRFHPMEQMRPPMPPQQQQQQQQQPEFPPSSILQHIAQQIIAQKIMEGQKASEESGQEQQEDQRIPLPEEVLTQLNRLPNRDVIVAVSEPEQDGGEQPQQEIRVVQEQRQSPHEMNGRQTYGRGMMVPVAMIAQQQQPQREQQPTTAQEPQAAATEEARPHCKMKKCLLS